MTDKSQTTAWTPTQIAASEEIEALKVLIREVMRASIMPDEWEARAESALDE